jgi:hypothetical protein
MRRVSTGASHARVIFAPGEEMARSGQQAAARRLRHGGGARRKAELAEDVCDVAVHGVLAQKQPLADVLVVQAVGDQPQDLELTRRQTGGRRGARLVLLFRKVVSRQ